MKAFTDANIVLWIAFKISQCSDFVAKGFCGFVRLKYRVKEKIVKDR